MPRAATARRDAMEALHPSQAAALAFVEEVALAKAAAVRRDLLRLLAELGLAADDYTAALASIAAAAPIDVSFHPDRLDKTGETVVQSLHSSGRYKNQFESGISNGVVTAVEGGKRVLWEARLFGGAYQQRGVAARYRPKYGALNLLGHWDGACPRFGSCYFRLKPHVARRCSFAFGDSAVAPVDLGTIASFDGVLAATLKAIHATGRALGGEDLEVGSFLKAVTRATRLADALDFDGRPGRNLDDCIEVHIHGPLDLASDVACLVADGSFRPTETGDRLVELSIGYGFDLHWTPGFFLSTADIPPDFRGPQMGPLAQHIASDGLLDAVKIGAADRALKRNPEDWGAWGSFEETLQLLKQLWHVLATFGSVGKCRTRRDPARKNAKDPSAGD